MQTSEICIGNLQKYELNWILKNVFLSSSGKYDALSS